MRYNRIYSAMLHLVLSKIIELEEALLNCFPATIITCSSQYFVEGWASPSAPSELIKLPDSPQIIIGE